jgi:hypothetical protein
MMFWNLILYICFQQGFVSVSGSGGISWNRSIYIYPLQVTNNVIRTLVFYYVSVKDGKFDALQGDTQICLCDDVCDYLYMYVT